MPITVVNVKKQYLQKNGYTDLEDWLKNPNHIYIGRDMSFYVKGAKGSKWKNPYKLKLYSSEQCLKLYKEHIINNPQLYDSIDELDGKVLGCWCVTPTNNYCHGMVLKEIFEEKMKNKNNNNQIKK